MVKGLKPSLLYLHSVPIGGGGGERRQREGLVVDGGEVDGGGEVGGGGRVRAMLYQLC